MLLGIYGLIVVTCLKGSLVRDVFLYFVAFPYGALG